MKPTSFHQLRPYQKAALDAVLEKYEAGHRRMLLIAPTGSGKTIIFAHIARWLGISDRLVLVLAHRDELIEQAKSKYAAANPGVVVGIEKGTSFASARDDVIVASVQTLRGARLKKLISRCGRPALIITDEAHHAASPSYQAIYKACGVTRRGSIVHVGVTATPRRTDGVGLESAYDVVAYSIELKKLIKESYLAPIRGHRVQTRTDIDEVHTRAGDLDGHELGRTVNTPERNAAVVAAYQSVAHERKALVFAASVAHSLALTKAFVAAGYGARHVDGSTPLIERRKTLNDFTNGEFKILVNCGVFIEGFDEPSIDAVILARPTKSTLLFMQMLGRGIRTHPGKSHLIVVDMVDVTTRHSIVTLPTILGLPANFDLRGRDLRKIAEKWDALAKESPEAIDHVMDAFTLEKAMKMTATLRYDFIQTLIAKARKSQEIVEFDFFAAPQLPRYIAENTDLAWEVIGNNCYRLCTRDQRFTIAGEPGGKYSVLVIDVRTKSELSYEEYDDVLSAFATAEQRARDAEHQRVAHIERSASWRRLKASRAQLEYIKSFGIVIRRSKPLSRGTAAAIINALKNE